MNSTKNISALSEELTWLAGRIKSLEEGNAGQLSPLPAIIAESSYGKLVNEYGLTESERVVLILTFAAVYKPTLLISFAISFMQPENRARSGGFYQPEQGLFCPTLRTAIYLLANGDEEMTSYYISFFNSRQRLFTSSIIHTQPNDTSHHFLDQKICFNDQFLPAILNGEAPSLDSGPGFPARRGSRQHTMKEVVLDEKTISELEKLRRFARNMKKLWEMPESSRYRRNFICVFTGDPGTGKSHTAEAIGNELILPVYKINLAQLVSKYIGETEKNLERVFDRFSGHPAILFFDEAEAVFSKRTEVKDSHDKHANNEQSYLLQKIEDFDGIVILATNVQNLAQYFDKAFQRRIRQIVTFSFPEYGERLRLWENALVPPYAYEEGLTERLARNYQLSGGSIYNVVSEGVIEALDRDTQLITFEMLDEAMRDEFKKTGRKYEVCTDDKVMQDPARRHGQGYEQRKNF